MRKLSIKLYLSATIFFSIIIVLDRYHISELLNFNHFNWHTSYGASINQHLSGWYGYYHDKWRFPFTITNSLNFPSSSSIVLTDSLPIFAIISKLFKPFFSDTFHYFGIWKIICIVFLSISSFFLCYKYINKDGYISFLFSIFSISSFPLFIREGNPTLNGHFLLIIGIYLYFKLINEFNFKSLFYSVLILLFSFHIHFYFFIFVFLFIFSGITQRYFNKQTTLKETLEVLLCIFFILLIFAFINGYFFHLGNLGFDRFDNKGMPLISMFVGSNELNFKTLFNNNSNVIYISEQYESLNYLGISLISMIAISTFSYFKNNNKLKNHGVIFILFIIIFIYSLGGKIYFSENFFIEYNHHELPFMSTITGLLAVSGRMFIFNYIVLTYFCFNQFSSFKFNKFVTYCLLTIFTCIQFYEIYILNFSNKNIFNNVNEIKSNSIFRYDRSYQYYTENDLFFNKIPLNDINIIIPPYVCEGSAISQKIYSYLLINKKKVNSIWQGRDNYNCKEKIEEIKLLINNNMKNISFIFLNNTKQKYEDLDQIKINLKCSKFDEFDLCFK